MKIESGKCAEVFRNGPGKFTFYCTLCAKQFEIHVDALDHIETHFSFGQDDTKFKTSFTETEPEDSIDLQTEKIFVPGNEDYIIDLKTTSISNEDNETTGKIVIQNEFQRLASNLLSENFNCLDEIKVEPYKIETTEIKKTKKPRKKYSKAKKYSRFALVGRKEIVECDICKNHLKKTNLRSHMAIHLNYQKFVCDICSKKFNLIDRLKKHIRTAHSNSKMYVCQYCSHRCHDKSNLERHISIHTGEKPYKCDTCGKGCTQPSALKVHIRTHTKEKPYTCGICNKSFTASSTYVLHKRRHAQVKKYNCSICDKAFVSKTALGRHFMIHTGERPYSCDTCSATFNKRYIFTQHLLLHTNEKPYKCRVCDIHFCQTAQRRVHEKTIHSDILRSSIV